MADAAVGAVCRESCRRHCRPEQLTSDGFAGAIYGGLFLQRFVRKAQAWAHVDTFAWNPRNRPGRPEGGMSQGVRAAFALLAERYAG